MFYCLYLFPFTNSSCHNLYTRESFSVEANLLISSKPCSDIILEISEELDGFSSIESTNKITCLKLFLPLIISNFSDIDVLFHDVLYNVSDSNAVTRACFYEDFIILLRY